jgi:hypothetical protein
MVRKALQGHEATLDALRLVHITGCWFGKFGVEIGWFGLRWSGWSGVTYLHPSGDFGFHLAMAGVLGPGLSVRHFRTKALGVDTLFSSIA